MTATVTVTVSTKKTIELPKYFKSTYYSDAYFMVLNDKNYVRFFKRELDNKYADGPEFQINSLEYISGWAEKGFEPMCEQEFLEIFSETLMLMNEIVNNHVKN